MNRDAIVARIVNELANIAEIDPTTLNEDSPLIGRGAIIKSVQLVELLLAMEDFAENELNAEFDWSSDAAMSSDGSPFRSVSALADTLAALKR